MNTASNLQIMGKISLLIIICLLSFPAYAKYGGGTGELYDPFLIYTAEHINAISIEPNDWDKHFKLMADIDLNPNLPGRKVFNKAVIAPDTDMETGEYVGIPFTGVFNGNDHTISHLTIIGDRYLGLFGKLDSGAIISNLGLEAVDVKVTDSGAGRLVGLNEVIDITRYSTERGGAVGGLVGFNNGTITTSYCNGTVSGSGVVGGLVGFNNGVITTSNSTGMVTGDGSVGGLVGYNYGNIIISYSTGTVKGGVWIGGLVGWNDGGSIKTSYSIGMVTGIDEVGGLVGKNLTSNTFPFHSSITSSFWDIETSGQPTSAGGTGLTTAEMQDINTYIDAGWDFVDEISNGTCDYWQISPDDYPRLCYHDGNRPVMPEGLGTAGQPYLIRNELDLGTVWFEPLAYYLMEASVDLSEITWSMAVIPWFDGTFDGNGYVISNLHIHGGDYLGLFGQLGSEAEISNLSTEAINVNGTGDYVGGLVAYNGGYITTCCSTGTVGGDRDCTGGLVGYNYGSLTSSYSTSAITGYEHVGGLVGYNGNLITDCYSAGAVSGERWIGGFVSFNLGHITNCYSIGAINGLWGGLMGGGEADSVTASFWDTQTSKTIYSGGGTGKTTAQMQTASTFINAGWDFVDETANGMEDIWWMPKNDYPRLWWEESN